MEKYVGMDVHAQSCTVCSLRGGGKRLSQDVVATNGRALVEYFSEMSGEVHLCFEECEWSSWLYEILSPHVSAVVVARGQRKKSASKSDAIDAHDLAERLRTGRIEHPVFKAPRAFVKLREEARVYWAMTRDLTRAKNRLKSTFRRRGVHYEGARVYGEKGRAQRLRRLPAAMRGAATVLAEQVDYLEELKEQAESTMVEESHRHGISRILETVPGLGPVRVAQLLPIVVTPHRFRTKRQFWAYCGFAVVTHSSADWVRTERGWVRARVAQTRGLNVNYNHQLKMIFKGAATTVIMHAAPGPFREAYDRLCEQGTKPNLAKLTVARKIAATVLAMWKNQEAYDSKRQDMVV